MARVFGLGLLTTAFATGAAGASGPPTPVSPGRVGATTRVEARCPTFSWAGAPEARGYQLAVLRVTADSASEPELVLRFELPGDSRSFTPPVEQCLERGERYAWSVATIGMGNEPPEWSPAFMFAVEKTAGPSETAGEVAAVNEAIAVLERFLERRSGAGRSAAAGQPSVARAQPGDAGAAGRGPHDRARDATARDDRAVVDGDSESIVRAVAAASPVLGSVSLTVANQVHLSAASAIFKAGDVFMWDDNTAGNTALGREALESVTTGTGNTAVGRDALRDTTGGAAFGGSFNTAVGDEALLANTTGKRNTALGAGALIANLNGSGSTAIGASALKDNTSGEYNTAVGAFSLRLNTTGDDNTAIGVYALRNNGDGHRNTAVGNYALRTNATGNDNTAMGYGSLRSNLAGFNAALGTNSLRDNSTGASNTATGPSALLRNTEGNTNAAHGSNALANNTSGSRNTAVGAVAGYYATTGNDNIFIGSGANGVGGEGNTIRIGGSVVGDSLGQQNRTFINGIRGVTPAGAIGVVISSSGQLGTVSSSRAVKQDIRDLGPLADRLLALRPVAFRYRQHVASDPQTPLEFGLIAEEVAEVLPELVVFDQEGEPETVKYHLLSSLLLSELKDQHGELAELRRRLRLLEARPSREVPTGRQRDRPSAGSRRR